MRILILLSLILAVPTAGAQQHANDEHVQKALQQTQQQLRDKNEREKAVNENEKTKAADAYIDQVGINKDETYDLTADIMADLVKQTEGDPKKLQELMEQAKRDPAAFARSLSPENQRKIQDLAKPIGPPNQKK